MTEHNIQSFLWEQKDNWAELIVQIDFPEKYIFDDSIESIHSLSPFNVIYNQIIDRLEKLYGYTFGIRLFGCKVPLKKEGDSTIRADLLGIIEGVAGIALIEIKKSSQTERQAYTELLAYASHLRTIFPAMSRDDISYILISPMEERIVREATIQSLLFDENPVFAFIPEWQNNDINTLKLKPWIPNIDEIINITGSAFAQKNFEIFKVTWDKIDGWNANAGENPKEFMVERMNKIASHAAQLMEVKGIHGFVYCSQLYPELPFLPNALTIVALNPFRIAKDYFLIKQGINPNNISDEAINILDIIPELANKAKAHNEENGYLHDLIITWGNTICKIGFDTVNLMISNNNSVNIELGYGDMTWEQYQSQILENV